jgi:uncharacterized protein YecE (DUF72 family)
MVLSNSAIRIPHSTIEDGVFIGTSGYNYPHWWNGAFYPSDLPQKKWLEFYTDYFTTVELNVSFYRLPKKEVFEGWYKRTPKRFLFAVKGNRFITHLKRLKDCRDSSSRRRDWRNSPFFSQPSLVPNFIAMPLSSGMNPGSAPKPFESWKNFALPFASPMVQAFLL